MQYSSWCVFGFDTQCFPRLIADWQLKIWTLTVTTDGMSIAYMLVYCQRNGFFFNFWCLNATFSNISAISWWSVLLVEDPEKITDMSQVTDKLYHIMLYTLPWAGIESTTSVVICTDCIGSCNPTTIRPRCPPIVECMTNNGNIYAIERGFNKHYLLFPR